MELVAVLVPPALVRMVVLMLTLGAASGLNASCAAAAAEAASSTTPAAPPPPPPTANFAAWRASAEARGSPAVLSASFAKNWPGVVSCSSSSSSLGEGDSLGVGSGDVVVIHAAGVGDVCADPAAFPELHRAPAVTGGGFRSSAAANSETPQGLYDSFSSCPQAMPSVLLESLPTLLRVREDPGRRGRFPFFESRAPLVRAFGVDGNGTGGADGALPGALLRPRFRRVGRVVPEMATRTFTELSVGPGADATRRYYNDEALVEHLDAICGSGPNGWRLVGELSASDVTYAGFWMGDPGTTATLHYDVEPNVVVQLTGQKAWTLIPPRFHAEVALAPRLSPNHRQAQRAFDAPVGEQGQDNVEKEVVLLRPGDALYVPPFWLHEVSSCGVQGRDLVSAANFWTYGGASVEDVGARLNVQRAVHRFAAQLGAAGAQQGERELGGEDSAGGDTDGVADLGALSPARVAARLRHSLQGPDGVAGIALHLVLQVVDAALSMKSETNAAQWLRRVVRESRYVPYFRYNHSGGDAEQEEQRDGGVAEEEHDERRDMQAFHQCEPYRWVRESKGHVSAFDVALERVVQAEARRVTAALDRGVPNLEHQVDQQGVRELKLADYVEDLLLRAVGPARVPALVLDCF